MSHVTNVVLLFPISHSDEPGNGRTHAIIEKLNEQCASVDFSGRGSFVRADHLAGGPKVFEARAYLAAFNFVDVAELLATIWALPSEEPDLVQVLIKDQHDEKFTLHEGPTE